MECGRVSAPGGHRHPAADATNVCVSVGANKALYVTGVSTTCTSGTTFVGVDTASDGTMSVVVSSAGRVTIQ